MDLHLHGKTAVVTGASRGIGLATCRALAHEGVRVVGAARTITPKLEEVAVATVAADLSTADGAAAVVDGALAELGGIDILINNVGAGDADRIGLGGFLDVDDDDQWRHLFADSPSPRKWQPSSRSWPPRRRGNVIGADVVIHGGMTKTS